MQKTFFISFVLFSLHLVGLGFQPKHVASQYKAITPKEYYLSNVENKINVDYSFKFPILESSEYLFKYNTLNQ